jgi:hypothetical protein
VARYLLNSALIAILSWEDTTMASNTLDKRTDDGDLGIDVDNLRQFIEERFPAEAARADMSDLNEVVRLATELLERLWRWEN